MVKDAETGLKNFLTKNGEAVRVLRRLISFEKLDSGSKIIVNYATREYSGPARSMIATGSLIGPMGMVGVVTVLGHFCGYA